MSECQGCGGSIGPEASIACPNCANPQGPFRVVQILLIVTVLLALLAQWLIQTPFSEADGPASVAGVASDVTQAWSGSLLGKSVLVVTGLFVAASLLVCLAKGPAMVRSVAGALRVPIGVPKDPRRVLMGGFLLAFLVYYMVEAFVVGGLTPSAQLAIAGGPTVRLPTTQLTIGATGDDTPRTLWRSEEGWVGVDPEQVKRWGPDRIRVAGLSPGEVLVLDWEIAQARIEGRGGVGARLDGEPLPKVARLAAAGTRLQLGELDAVIEGPRWQHVVRAVAAGKAAALVLLLIGCGLMGGRSLFTELGLVTTGWKTELKRGAAGMWAFLPIYIILSLSTVWLGQQAGVPVENHPLVQAVQREGLALFAFVVLQAVFIAPILEEILFRGLLIGAAQRSVGKTGALIVSAVGFALLHIGFASILPMLGLGLVFGAIRLSSPNQSLLGVILAHAMFNALTLTVLFATLV